VERSSRRGEKLVTYRAGQSIPAGSQRGVTLEFRRLLSAMIAGAALTFHPKGDPKAKKGSPFRLEQNGAVGLYHGNSVN